MTNDGDEFNVEAILGKKGRGKTLQYHVQWEGYAETTWEPLSSIEPGGRKNVVLREWLTQQQQPNKQQPKKTPAKAAPAVDSSDEERDSSDDDM